MSKRKIIDESDARVCLAGVLGSGLSLREWSRENGIDGRSLHMWRLALERRAAPSARASGPLVRDPSAHRDDDERVTVHAP